ncbi:prenyltransferase, partial [Streptomyces sp. NPDC005813]
PRGPRGPRGARGARGVRGGQRPGRTARVTHRAGDRHVTAVRRAVPSALALATHTLAVTTVSRGETQGGSPVAPLAALATTGALAWGLTSRPAPGAGRAGGGQGPAGPTPSAPAAVSAPTGTLRTALTLAYAATSARPFLHAALNPSPPLVQRAVGGGIRAMIPLQATLAARAGAPVTALLTAALAPAARRFARKVSVT